ncbi:MAG: PaaI family thioesterase [Xanthomonadales bacterium]|nr:PaaI family thioesterase [Xanthomonadales bacterium]NIX13821.1 PaaI family thioesterase [Xanthomonadales bacterium]
MNSRDAFQDHYPDDLNHCYGCGSRNEQGHHLKSYWDGDRTVASFLPGPHHTAIPGYVYGGLIASLIDCHGTGSAAAAVHRAEGRPMGSAPPVRFVTASIRVDYLAPTPMGVELRLEGEIAEVGERKVVVDVSVSAAGKVTARGRVIAVRMPQSMVPGSAG